MAVNLNAPRRIVGELIYSGYGRIVHSFWLRAGAFVTDDFGNSVNVGNTPVLNFIRQEA